MNPQHRATNSKVTVGLEPARKSTEGFSGQWSAKLGLARLFAKGEAATPEAGRTRRGFGGTLLALALCAAGSLSGGALLKKKSPATRRACRDTTVWYQSGAGLDEPLLERRSFGHLFMWHLWQKNQYGVPFSLWSQQSLCRHCHRASSPALRRSVSVRPQAHTGIY